MSKITLDNLSDNLKAYLEGLGLSEEQVLNLINENGLDEEELKAMLKDTMSINELNTNSKTIIGAINELFQSANNGKQLIANAIGEPLDSNDTFSAMSNDINGLLSSFKTNMMNSGVTVESSDKFKQLIDKIKGLTEGEGNKGIQYAEGIETIIVDSSSSGDFRQPSTWEPVKQISINVGFKPMYVLLVSEEFQFCRYEGTYYSIPQGYFELNNMSYCDINYTEYGGKMVRDAYWYNDGTSDGSEFIFDRRTEINNTGFDLFYRFLHVWSGYSIQNLHANVPLKWIAIGVGEEDTTLRDSLASILQEEGVSVTEEDDMASLITKVDEEFDRQVVPAGTAVASDVAKGKTFINNTGDIITGTAVIHEILFENGGDESLYTADRRVINYGNADLTHENGYLNFYCSGSSYQTNTIYFTLNENLDLTDKTAVWFDLSISGNAAYTYFSFGVYEGTGLFSSDVTLAKGYYTEYEGSVKVPFYRAKYRIDVSACTGIHKIGIYLGAYGSYSGRLELYNIEIE